MKYEEKLIQFETQLGTMYYEIYADEVRLYDSDKSYSNHDSVCDYIREDEDPTDEEIGQRIIETYKNINVGDGSIMLLGEPVMWSDSLNNLLNQWNAFCNEQQENEEEPYEPYETYTMEEFKDNIQYNVIGNTWFIIYYTEY